jgi:hypothetical protein
MNQTTVKLTPADHGRRMTLADFEHAEPTGGKYKTPPLHAGGELWSSWVPELVIEVVSPGSEERDYVEKREEYLRVGVQLYWVVDADKGEMLTLRRRGGRWDEEVVRPPAVYRPTLFPGLEFDVAAVFAAAAGA